MDIDYILKRQEYYKDLSEKTENEVDKTNYTELYDMYSLLVLERIFSDGEVISSGVSAKEKLTTLQEEGCVDDYSSELKEGIISKFKDIDIELPYVQFSKFMKGDKLIHLIGEAIHDIFGDEAYKDYKSIALDTNNKIQIGNRETRACMHHITDNGKEDYYILLPQKSNISIVNTLAHESGHHHRFMINPSDIKESHLLREYESFSYELRVLDYFIKNGIYKKEAIKAMIRIINLIDSMSGMINNLDLIDSTTVRKLTESAHKRNLYQKYHIPNNEVLLDYLYTIKTDYVFPYIFSALCVFEDMSKPNGIDKYETVIQEIGKTEEMDLVKRIVENEEDINNLKGYKKYKKEIKEMYGGKK